MNIAFFSTKSYDRTYFDQYVGETSHKITYFETALTSATASLAADCEAVCAFVNDKLDHTCVEALSKIGIQCIALRCAGFNNVDLKAAAQFGITVVRVPAYSPQAVAEHAVALILTLNRKTHKAYNRVREGNFSLERLTGFDLYGKTVGVIGTGGIGAIFCKIMLGFNCRVLAFDPMKSQELEDAGVEYTSFDAVLEQSDILSLHCPLNAHTHHLINGEAYDKMKTGSMLINTSRGGLVDTRATVEALKHGKLGYLGIDVYEQEEHLFFQDLSESIIQDELISRLISFPNVLITAHQGFFTKEALTNISKITLENLSQVEAGKEVDNEVRMSVL